MILSMTSYARREARREWGTLAWEIRSLNHRYLDLSLRLPEEFRPLEGTVRERIASRVHRGKVECSLRFQPSGAVTTDLTLNRPLVERLIGLCVTVNGLHDTPGTVDPLRLLAWPGVVESGEPDLDPVLAEAVDLLDATVDELVATRAREGERIRDMLLERLDAIDRLVSELRSQLPALRETQRTRIERRLAELDIDAEPGRLEQELVLVLARMDVDEELDRLQAHVQEVRQVLDRDEPVGRRLDFLMQELNREANTLGSKSNASETTRTSVELKVLIEQMREQIQNVE